MCVTSQLAFDICMVLFTATGCAMIGAFAWAIVKNV